MPNTLIYEYNIETWFPHICYCQNQHPYCESNKEWSQENIREDFHVWLQKVFNPDEAFWLQTENSDPIDARNPVIEVSIFPLLNRTPASRLSAGIKSWEGRILAENVPIIEGSFQIQIPSELGKLDGKLKLNEDPFNQVLVQFVQ